MSLKRIILLVKNPSTQLWETEEENRTKKSINKKLLELDEEIWEENQKIIDIVDKENLSTRTNGQKKKTKGM